MTDQNYVLRTYDMTHYIPGDNESRGVSGFSVELIPGGGHTLPLELRKINGISNTSGTIAFTENHVAVDSPASN